LALTAPGVFFVIDPRYLRHILQAPGAMNRFACAAVFALSCVCTSSAESQAGSRPADLSRLSRSLESVVATISPAIVQIRATAYGPVSGGSSATGALLGTQRSTGSGVILSPDGYIVTNAHVVDGGRRFVVVLPRPVAAGVPARSALAPVSQEVPASLIGTDTETDLAVLKVTQTNLPFARLGDSDSLAPGQVVLAFGSPFGLASSVTMGVISAVGRQLTTDGAVVGINTLIFSQSGGSQGVGFAAPGNIVRFVYDQIRTNRRVRRGEIGVFAQTITPAIAAALKLPRDWGVVLGDVYPNSPAARAGLRINDVILSLDGKPMENGRQFDVNVYRRPIGGSVSLEVGRGLQRTIIRVPVVERRDEEDRFRDLVTPEQNLIPRLGILGLDLTPELARGLPGLRSPHGVIVAVVASADGDGSGLVPGDVIHGVNGSSVRTLSDLRAAVDQIAADSAAVLHVGRRGRLRFVTAVLD
jgi:serine protease Do